MKYLVAVATYSGENIDLHFGHCSEFQVIEVTDNESWEVTGSIEAGRACDGQCNHDYIGDVAQKLKDCRYVLSAKIGPGAAKIVRDLGPVPLEIEAPVDYAIGKLMTYDNRRENANRN